MTNTLNSRASAAATASGNSGDFSANNCSSVAIDIEIASVTATDSIVFALKKRGEDGTYNTIWTSASQTGAASLKPTVQISGGIQSVADILQLVWTITNVSGSPSVTFSSSVVGNQ